MTPYCDKDLKIGLSKSWRLICEARGNDFITRAHVIILYNEIYDNNYTCINANDNASPWG